MRNGTESELNEKTYGQAHYKEFFKKSNSYKISVEIATHCSQWWEVGNAKGQLVPPSSRGMSWLWRMSGWLSFNETLGETNPQSRAINITSWLFERCLIHRCLRYMLWYFPIAGKMSLLKSGQKQGGSMRFELQGRETECRPDVIVQFCRTFFRQLQWELAIFALVNK